MSDELRELDQLHQDGHLSDEEFAQAKARVIQEAGGVSATMSQTSLPAAGPSGEAVANDGPAAEAGTSQLAVSPHRALTPRSPAISLVATLLLNVAYITFWVYSRTRDSRRLGMAVSPGLWALAVAASTMLFFWPVPFLVHRTGRQVVLAVQGDLRAFNLRFWRIVGTAGLVGALLYLGVFWGDHATNSPGLLVFISLTMGSFFAMFVAPFAVERYIASIQRDAAVLQG